MDNFRCLDSMNVLLNTVSLEINSEEWESLLIEISKFFKVSLSSSQAKDMRIHATELIRWNKIINLTAITNPVEVIVKHFIDSMAVVSFINKKSNVLDMGSGGGFPAIPIKVMLPLLSVTMVDSYRKKYSFLKHIIRILDLQKTDVINLRCEDLAIKDVEHKYFDIVMCRAFTSLANFIKMANPFLSSNGTIIAMKGKIADENYKIIDGIRIGEKYIYKNQVFSTSSYFYNLPIFDIPRNLIFIKRIA